jgi:hypothetical protein
MLTRPTTTLAQILSTVERTPVQPAPFPHLDFESFLPAEVYADLIRSLPETRYYRGMAALRREDRFTRFKFDLFREYIKHVPREQRAVLTDLSEALRSPELGELFKAKFREVLEARFELPLDRIRMYPVPSFMRDYSGIALHVHTDTFSKVITVQCYLPQDREQESLGTHFHDSQQGEAVKKVPFVPNHAYAFPVHKGSFHSVPTLTGLTRPRDSLMLLYYNTTQPLRGSFYNARRVSSFIGYSFGMRREPGPLAG